jgi:hypothetical protein
VGRSRKGGSPIAEKEVGPYADEWELPDLTDAVEVFREHIVRMATAYRNLWRNDSSTQRLANFPKAAC